MAYRGENIDFTIKGDSEFDLDKLSFVVLIYPDRHPELAITINKEDGTKIAPNQYHLWLEYNMTVNIALGLYTIEVLIIEDAMTRSIFMKQGAFPVYDSASNRIP